MVKLGIKSQTAKDASASVETQLAIVLCGWEGGGQKRFWERLSHWGSVGPLGELPHIHQIQLSEVSSYPIQQLWVIFSSPFIFMPH